MKQPVYLSLDDGILEQINKICKEKNIRRATLLRIIIKKHLQNLGEVVEEKPIEVAKAPVEATNIEMEEVKSILNSIQAQIATIKVGGRTGYDPTQIEEIAERTKMAMNKPVTVSLMEELKGKLKSRGDVE